MLERKPFKVQAVAQLLDTSVDSVRRYVDESGLEVRRQENGPKTRLFSIENVYRLAHWRRFERKAREDKDKNKDSGRRVPVIATVYTAKGGVGKTTITSNLAALFPLMGVRTLVIDIDDQSNLSLAYGYDPELTLEEAIEDGIPAEDVIQYHLGHLVPDYPGGAKTLAEVLKKPLGEYGPHLVPADVTLDMFDTMLTYAQMQNFPSDTKLVRLIKQGLDGTLKGLDFSQYDLILFDAAPAKSNRITRAALLASDYVISPVAMEKYSTKALSLLAATLEQLKEQHHRCPEQIILGNFFNSNRPRVLDNIRKIRTHYKGAWLDATIRTSEEFKKNLESEGNLPLALEKQNCDASRELVEVAKSLLNRMKVQGNG